MRIDGITLLEGSKANNLTIASGTSYPSNPDLGEIFFRTDLDAVHVYASGGWEGLGGGGTYTAGTGLTLSSNEFSITSPISTALLGSGTANNTTFLRGDGTWAAPASTSASVLYGTGSFASTWNVSQTAVWAGTKSGGSAVAFSNSAASSGNRLAYFQKNTDGRLHYYLADDTNASFNPVFSIYRSGNTATQINAVATAINLTGAVVGTSFSGDGSALTDLNATNISTGTVGTARLGTGTANGTTFLRGDGTWATPSTGTATALSGTASQASSSSTSGVYAGIIGSIPAIHISNVTAGTNAKIWELRTDNSGTLQLNTVNDAINSNPTIFSITRSGTTGVLATLTTTGVNLAVGSGGLQLNGSAGTSGHVLTSNGGSAAPTWQAVSPNGSITTAVNDTTTSSGVYAGTKDGYGALFVVNGSAPANARKIKIYQGNTAGDVYLSLVNDADSTGTQILNISRSGNTATNVALTTTMLQVVGQAAFEGTWSASVAANNVRAGTNANGGILSFSSSTASSTNRLSYFMVDNTGSLYYRLATDNNGGNSTVFQIDRSGNTATAATLTATTINLTGGTRLKQTTYDTTVVSASDVDCSAGNFFKKTVSGTLTWTASNVPSSRFYSFILQLTNAGTGTMTWFSGTKWAGGTAPTLTVSGVDILGFYTEDSGTTWRGVVLALDSK